jgi:hypothetical protein
MSNFRTKIRTTQNLRTKILALGVALCATPVAASQPIWQPAIYCAALDFTRAALLTHAEGDVPDWVGTPESAAQSGRAYLRIAADYLRNAELSLRHRMEVAISYGVDREVMVLPIASEAELVCAINFAPEVLAAARAAEATDPPRALCPAPQ